MTAGNPAAPVNAIPPTALAHCQLRSDILGLPTVWIPHSYPGCAQHAPDEHMLAPVAREGLMMMAGLWWDPGEARRSILG